jgi:hypothetical protein
MYTPVKVDPLSKNQVSKLLRGQPARVKYNPRGPHTVKVSQEQRKKLAKASVKGSGVVLTFDPYQVDMHREQYGDGINWGKIGKALKGVVTSDIGKKAQKFLVDKAFDVLPLPKGIEDVGKKLAYKGIEAQGFPMPLRSRVAKPKKATKPRAKPKRKTGGAMFPAGYSF